MFPDKSAYIVHVRNRSAIAFLIVPRAATRKCNKKRPPEEQAVKVVELILRLVILLFELFK